MYEFIVLVILRTLNEKNEEEKREKEMKGKKKSKMKASMKLDVEASIHDKLIYLLFLQGLKYANQIAKLRLELHKLWSIVFIALFCEHGAFRQEEKV